MKILTILQCTKKKEDHACPAEEMYGKGLKFKKFLPLVKQIPNNTIKIFSAKYGLVDLNQVIEPYQATLEFGIPAFGNQKKPTKEELKKHKANAIIVEEKVTPILRDQISRLNLSEYDKVICIFSKRYKDVFTKAAMKEGLNTSNFIYLQDNCGSYFKMADTICERIKSLIL